MGVLDLFVFGVPLLIEHVGQTTALRYLCRAGFRNLDPSDGEWFQNPMLTVLYNGHFVLGMAQTAKTLRKSELEKIFWPETSVLRFRMT